MEKLIILGTGNAMVTRCYNTCFAISNGNEYFLVDAGGGNGILRQLEAAKIDAAKIHHIFLTHEHTDHLLGMVWIIRKIASMMLAGKYEGDLNFYCHSGLVPKVKSICQMTMQKKFTDFFDQRIIFHVVEDGDRVQIFGWNCQFFDIHSTKARQFGFTLTLESGRKLACAGDEPYNNSCQSYVENADWLLHEAFCLYSERDRFKPYEKHHSTAKDAAELAVQLKIKNLLLYHTEDKNLKNRKQLYTEEAKACFDGNIWVPYDLEEIALDN